MSYVHLSEAERNVIFRMGVQGQKSSQIALATGRSPSTISRELRRNAESDGRYFPASAQVFANVRGRAHVRRSRTGNQRLMDHVTEHLERRWSPQQVAGRLRELPPTGLAGVTISHQTIYRWIWSDRQRSQRFKPLLRVAYRKRRKPYGKPSRRGQIPNRVSIEQRPPEVEQRRRLGDWEGDTIVGKARSGYVAAGVERASRYLVARKLTACTAQEMKSKLHEAMRRLPDDRRKTLTVDNGREFAAHRQIGRLLGLAVFFAHPYSAWERGTSENTNGLLRQYLPKNRSFHQLTEWELASYVLELNSRPRKCLNYRTPAEVFWRRSVALAM